MISSSMPSLVSRPSFNVRHQTRFSPRLLHLRRPFFYKVKTEYLPLTLPVQHFAIEENLPVFCEEKKTFKEKKIGAFDFSRLHILIVQKKLKLFFLGNPIVCLKIQMIKTLKIKLFTGFLHLTSLVFGGARDKRNFLRSISIVL